MIRFGEFSQHFEYKNAVVNYGRAYCIIDNTPTSCVISSKLPHAKIITQSAIEYQHISDFTKFNQSRAIFIHGGFIHWKSRKFTRGIHALYHLVTKTMIKRNKII